MAAPPDRPHVWRARLVDERRPGIGEGVRVVFCETRPLSVDVVRLVRDKGRGSGDGRLDAGLRTVVGDGRATLEEGWIDVGDVRGGHWEGTVSNEDRSKRKSSRAYL